MHLGTVDAQKCIIRFQGFAIVNVYILINRFSEGKFEMSADFWQRIIGSSLLELVCTVALGERGVVIARCEWVENPYIKKCTLPITSPEILGYNV